MNDLDRIDAELRAQVIEYQEEQDSQGTWIIAILAITVGAALGVLVSMYMGLIPRVG